MTAEKVFDHSKVVEDMRKMAAGKFQDKPWRVKSMLEKAARIIERQDEHLSKTLPTRK